MLFISIFGSLLSVFIAVLSFLKNPRSAQRRWLLIMAIGAAAWAASASTQVELAANGPVAIWFMRSAFAAAAIMAYAMVRFAFEVIQWRAPVWLRVLLTTYLYVVLILSFSPFVIETSGDQSVSSVLTPIRHWGYPIAVAQILISGGLSICFTAWRAVHVRGFRRTQLSIVAVGLAAGFVAGIVTNVILPNVTGSTYASRFAFVPVFVWTSILTYAIVQHKFMDLRLAAVRTLAYAITLVVIVGAYVAVLFGLSDLILQDTQDITAQTELFFVGVAVVMAITFAPLKRFFDRLTRAVFYRDAYETKVVLDAVTSAIVHNTTVDGLARSSLSILQSALKAESLLLVTVNTKTKHAFHHISVGRRKINSDSVIEDLLGRRQPMLILEELEGVSAELYHVLQGAGVALVARISISHDTAGFIILGYKAGGNTYNTQDIELVRIVADELVVAIQNALRFEEISQFNVTLKQEVDDATAELRKTNQKLRELDKAKDEFLSMASHQLRTPLTSVKGYLSMALEGDAGKLNEGQKSLLKESYGSAQRMVYLVNDFLNVSRIKTGKFAIDRSSVALQDVIKQEVTQLQPAAHVRSISLNVDVPHGFERLQLDESKVRQVVMNLIDNAIYYSKEGGQVDITLRKVGEWAEFMVQDHGIGVPLAEQPHMFEKFFRATNAKKARSDGTGVGLFVAKKVITSHGGQMIFSSQQGKGSTFGFKLPLGRLVEEIPES